MFPIFHSGRWMPLTVLPYLFSFLFPATTSLPILSLPRHLSAPTHRDIDGVNILRLRWDIVDDTTSLIRAVLAALSSGGATARLLSLPEERSVAELLLDVLVVLRARKEGNMWECDLREWSRDWGSSWERRDRISNEYLEYYELILGSFIVRSLVIRPFF